MAEAAADLAEQLAVAVVVHLAAVRWRSCQRSVCFFGCYSWNYIHNYNWLLVELPVLVDRVELLVLQEQMELLVESVELQVLEV